MRIEVVDRQSLPQLLALVAEYQRFYGVEPDEVQNATYFSGLLGKCDACVAFLAYAPDGTAVGFANLYGSLSTLQARRTWVLNDLFTDPAHRGQGVARALLAHAASFARCQGIPRLEWVTRPENLPARRLYESLGAQPSAWIAYELPLGEPRNRRSGPTLTP